MTCSNCNARLSCGCKRRTASDGKQCCSSCVGAYEKTLTNNNPKSEVTPKNTKSIWNKVRFNSSK